MKYSLHEQTKQIRTYYRMVSWSEEGLRMGRMKVYFAYSRKTNKTVIGGEV